MTTIDTPTVDPVDTHDAAILSATGLGHAYGNHVVLADIDFTVRSGEFVCLVGPSGAGKTTLLRCLAGLQTPTAGTVRFRGEPIVEPAKGVAVVFQDYSRSLMPWSSVTDNVALPLRASGSNRKTAREASERALRDVGLPERSFGKYPWQLSGGMQQRVVIARALAYQPSLVLMDEPFASVDAQTRADLEDLMRRLQSELEITVILVTHDIDEAVYLSDRVVVLGGSPAQVTEIIDVRLGTERDQIRTKSDPVFTQTRAHVISLIKRAPARAAGETQD